ncbi:MAG: glycosyltransferase family 4 protein [Parcubacteria group bacterium]|nr:glycosyltransferase family 4 protein [Parcubacteria group bacterium]
MIIGVDIRPLSGGRRSGVEEYALNLLLHLFSIDKKNKYKLFYNSFGKPSEVLELFQPFSNVEVCQFRYPNKFFNFSCKFFNRPRLDQLIKPVDVFFMPNILFSSLSDQCRKVITFHDLSYEFFPQFYSTKRRWWHRAVNPRRLAEQADKIIAVSASTKTDLVNYFAVAEEKIKVIHSGISTPPDITADDLLSAQKEYKLPAKFILHFAVIEPRKNVIGLVAAFEKLKQAGNIEHQLVLAGSPGWLYKKIYDRVRKSPVAADIKLLGFVKDKHKPALYKLADLFVFPSFYEGFGFPALEALSSGTPVVTSPVSSLPEICETAALYADPHDINKLTEAIKQGLQDKELRARLIKKGLEQTQKFSWGKSARETLAVFEEVGQ